MEGNITRNTYDTIYFKIPFESRKCKRMKGLFDTSQHLEGFSINKTKTSVSNE